MNQYVEDFMAQFRFEGLTFDDVSLVTAYADFLPDEAGIASKLTRRITVNIPIVSAAMDTVTEKDMAIAMAMLGGIGIIHRNLPQLEQAKQVATVKHHLHGLIRDPIVFRDTDTLDVVLERKKKKGYAFSGFPILDADEKLVGILTGADIKFARDEKVRVSEIMTSQVISAPEGTTLQDSYQIMKMHKIGKLPLVKGGKLTGLYSFSDVKTLVDKSDTMINRDDKYRLRVGAAVGPADHERIEALAAEEVDVVVVDTAHGDSKGVVEMVKWIKQHFPAVDVIGGNIATGQAAINLMKAGADAVKVGIGPGSICTTRVVAGVGVPQITAIHECAKALKGEIPIVADGGIRHSGDIPKAIVAGADTVMIGGLLAGAEESPGEKIFHQGRQYVAYRGMGSLGAMKENQGSRSRYLQAKTPEDELVPQGIEGIVPYAGPVRKAMVQFCGGLKAALGYCGCRTIPELKERGRIVRVSLAGLAEAHPHDVKIMKEAPNYRQGD
ncbi:MAG: IMP dehydrogenase [bacterium]